MSEGGPNSHPGTTLLDAALIEAHALDGVKRWPTTQGPSEATGQLSPAWVELLMGYPVGWTDPARIEPCGEHQGWPAPQGAPQFDYEPSRLAGPDDAENRRARVTALGNAVVRQCVAVAGARLFAIGAEIEALKHTAS